jgi:hypothetical protein
MSADYLELQTKVFMAESQLGFGPDPLPKQALRHRADYLANREDGQLAPSQHFQRVRLAFSHR